MKFHEKYHVIFSNLWSSFFRIGLKICDKRGLKRINLGSPNKSVSFEKSLSKGGQNIAFFVRKFGDLVDKIRVFLISKKLSIFKSKKKKFLS